MFDAKIVSACIESRRAYDQVRQHVDPREFTPTGQFWWKQIVRWYDADGRAQSVDATLLRERGEREAGRNAGMALDWYDARPSAPSPDNVAWEVLELKRTIKWRELAAAMEAEWDREAISKLVDEHAELMKATSLEQRSSVTWGTELEQLSEATSDKNRIRLWPEKLQERTRGAWRGGHIVLFGRPEVGKTLAAVNMTGGWLRDGHKVMVVGNEDNIDQWQARVRYNLAGMTEAQVQAHTEEANARCRRKGWANFFAVHMFPGSASEIAELVEEHKPDCLVIDQLRNMHSGSARSGGTKAQKLDDIANDVRQLAAKYGMVTLSLGQAHAGEHGKPKVWLETDDFDESRTGVPGSADLQIGVGMDAALDAHNQRAWSLCKNKFSGNHEGFIVTIDKQRSKVQ